MRRIGGHQIQISQFNLILRDTETTLMKIYIRMNKLYVKIIL